MYDVDDVMRPLVRQLATGWAASLEKQLIQKSHQENILKHTPKDAAQRFSDSEAVKAWLAKGREVHWLLGSDEDLAGIIWYGPAEPPHPIDTDGLVPETFAIRLYDGYVGKGLARPFMLQSLRVLVDERKASGKPLPFIWLETDIDNIPAVTSYTKFGYEEISRDTKRITMVLPPQKIQFILQ
jgi:GNAT superfamily N-acetyltransferase